MTSIQTLADLTGRVALITGGAGYIGQAMAEALAEQGCTIVLLDINANQLAEAEEALKDNYQVQVFGIQLDLEDEKAINQIPAQLQELAGKLDILINNAAFVGTSNLEGWVTDFAEQKSSVWRRALEVNLTSAFTLTQCCVPLLRASTSPSVINVASIYGVLGPDLSLYEGTPMGNPAAYAASKGGLLQLTRWLSTVIAPIRVNAISPGGIEREQPKLFQDRYQHKVPLARMGTETDMKGVTLFLASDMSAYLTGQNIMMDGGFSVW